MRKVASYIGTAGVAFGLGWVAQPPTQVVTPVVEYIHEHQPVVLDRIVPIETVRFVCLEREPTPHPAQCLVVEEVWQ